MEFLSILNGTPWANLFYHSPIRLDGKPHRGGIPLLFPQFAGMGPLRKHGYARDSVFAVHAEKCSGDHVHAVYSLEVGLGDWPEWPHQAMLQWVVQANADALTLTLEVCNTGQSAFSWTGGMHPYFAVSNIQDISITGFEGIPIHDKFNGPGIESSQPLSNFRGQEFERHYLAPASVEISDPGLSRIVVLKAQGFSEWMVWNPGVVLAGQLVDLPAGDWQRFICVEPMAGASPIHMSPGQVHKGVLTVTVRSLKV